MLARTSDARGLIDAAPHRAWQRACQAVRLLGDKELPNGVAAQAVRDDARRTLLETAARLLVDGVPEGVQGNEIRADLEWLLKLKTLVAERPPKQNRRLWNGEHDRLEKLLDEIQKSPPRRTAATAP